MLTNYDESRLTCDLLKNQDTLFILLDVDFTLYKKVQI